MERLTYYDCAGAACFDYESPVMNGVMANKAISRLAKYEDTGLTPERVAELAQAEREKGCDALEKANAEIERLRKAQRWIPVTERLPTGCGYYLSVVERIAPDELGGNNTRVKIMRWLGADWRYPTHIPKWINEAITETVTHWMPLPEPPKEGE